MTGTPKSDPISLMNQATKTQVKLLNSVIP